MQFWIPMAFVSQNITQMKKGIPPSREFSETVSLRQRLLLQAQFCFKLGTKDPEIVVTETLYNPKNGKKLKRKFRATKNCDDNSGPTKKKLKRVPQPLRDHTYHKIAQVDQDETVPNGHISPKPQNFDNHEVAPVLHFDEEETVEEMKRRAQKQRQEAARVTSLGLDCNILAEKADNQVLEVYKKLDKLLMSYL